MKIELFDITILGSHYYIDEDVDINVCGAGVEKLIGKRKRNRTKLQISNRWSFGAVKVSVVDIYSRSAKVRSKKASTIITRTVKEAIQQRFNIKKPYCSLWLKWV